MMTADKEKTEYIGFKCDEDMTNGFIKAQKHFTEEFGLTTPISKSNLIRMCLLGKINLSPFFEKEEVA